MVEHLVYTERVTGSSPVPSTIIMFYTYLIQSQKDKSYYCGITNDPQRRLIEHNKGNLKVTSFKKPWKLVYIKKHNSYKEARKHEKWLKKKNRDYKHKLAQLAPPEL